MKAPPERASVAEEDAPLRTFSCFIIDDRYAVPTLSFLLVGDEALARELALRRLMESPHHRGIEVLEGGERVFMRTRAEAAERADAAA
jgi:hypothetical protein